MKYSIIDGKAVIPNSVTKIDNDAFRGCTDLTFIEIPYSVTEMGEWVFMGCASLKYFDGSDKNFFDGDVVLKFSD